jgi:hypothetical protein
MTRSSTTNRQAAKETCPQKRARVPTVPTEAILEMAGGVRQLTVGRRDHHPMSFATMAHRWHSTPAIRGVQRVTTVTSK